MINTVTVTLLENPSTCKCKPLLQVTVLLWQHLRMRSTLLQIAFLDGYLPLLHSAWASDLGNERNPNDNEVSSNPMVTAKTTCWNPNTHHIWFHPVQGSCQFPSSGTCRLHLPYPTTDPLRTPRPSPLAFHFPVSVLASNNNIDDKTLTDYEPTNSCKVDIIAIIMHVITSKYA